MRTKKILSAFLALVLSASLMPFSARASGEPEAADDIETAIPAEEETVSYDGDAAYTINGVTVTRTSSAITNNCFTYAQEIYKKIWGVGFSSDPSSSDNMLRGVTSASDLKLTAEHIRNYITAAELGAVIRLTGSAYVFGSSDSVGHSQLLVQKDANGFTVLESGVSEGSREKYYTWSGYVSWWSGTANRDYIKYIKWPGAPAYGGTVTPEDCGCSESYSGRYVCTTVRDPLNIRSGHGTSYASVGSIPPGAEVYVTKANGTWAHVIYNGVEGFASMTYLRKIEEPVTPEDKTGDGRIDERDAALYLREGKPYPAALALQNAMGL